MLTTVLIALACAAAAIAVGMECSSCNCACDFCTRSFSDADTTSFAETPTAGRCYLNNESLGDWRIVSGKLEVVTPTTEAILRSNEPSDGYGGISVDITLTAAGQKPGICIRDFYSSDYRYIYIDEGTNNVVHGTWVSGVRTEVSVPVSVTFTVGITYTLKFIPFMFGAACGGTRELAWSICQQGDWWPPSSVGGGTVFGPVGNGALWINGNYECAIGSGFAAQQPGLYLRNVNATSPQWDNLVIHKRWPVGGPEGCNQMPSQCHGCCECGSMPIAVNVDLTGIATGTSYDCDWLVYLLTQQTYCLDEIEASGIAADTLTEPFEFKCGYAKWNCSGSSNRIFDAVSGLSCPSIGEPDCAPSAEGCLYQYYATMSATRSWNHDTQRCEWSVCVGIVLLRAYVSGGVPVAYITIAQGGAFYRYIGGDDSGPQCADRDPVTLTLYEDYPNYLTYGNALVTWPETITLTPTDTPCGDCPPPPTTTTTTTTTTPPPCDSAECAMTCPEFDWVVDTPDPCGVGCICKQGTGPYDAVEGEPCNHYCHDATCALYLGQSDDPLGLGRGFNNYWHDDTFCTDTVGVPATCNCWVFDSDGVWHHGDIAHVNAPLTHCDECLVSGECYSTEIDPVAGTCEVP